jgi:hypothetical protein
MKKVSLLLLVLLVSSWNAPVFQIRTAQAWWDVGHQVIASRAIDFLPAGWREFFSNYEWLINETTLYPDTVYRSIYSDEDPRHFIDLEVWTPSDPNTGTLHLAVEEFVQAMAEAMKAGDWNAVLLDAGRVAHYVADIHQPYHATVYYNPKGLHSVLDGSLQAHIAEMTLVKPDELGPLQPVSNLTDFVFSIARQSNSFLPVINRTLIDEGRPWSQELTSIIENRTNSAIVDVARVWVTAITRAGVQPPSVPPDNSLKVEVASGMPTNRTLDPAAPVSVGVFVSDKLGVGFIGSLTATLGSDALLASPINLDPSPQGKFSVYIPASLLAKHSGQSVTLRLTASGQAYQQVSVEFELDVLPSSSGQQQASPQGSDQMLYAYLGLSLAILIVAALMLVRRRRR